MLVFHVMCGLAFINLTYVNVVKKLKSGQDKSFNCGTEKCGCFRFYQNEMSAWGVVLEHHTYFMNSCLHECYV